MVLTIGRLATIIYRHLQASNNQSTGQGVTFFSNNHQRKHGNSERISKIVK
jgi:hypothetical protein